MSTEPNKDHAARATHRDLTAAIVVAILLAVSAGFGLGIAHERSSQPGTVVVPVDRTERTAACRCADRSDS